MKGKRFRNIPPPAAAVLSELKDFQRATVSYVFDKIYASQALRRRFLIADEVGLGKTLVAKGIIAKAAEHLLENEGKRRIDVVYICSNQSIARQNISRLTLVEQPKNEVPPRLTLLPLYLRDLHRNAFNFVSFTPGTSFDFGSSGGIGDERALMYNMIRRNWHFGSRVGPQRLLQCQVGDDNWQALIEKYSKKKIDPKLKNAYLLKLVDNGLHEEFRELSEKVARYKYQARVPGDLQNRRYRLIGNMRQLLAEVCIEMLEPDIVVMDEFQRFKNLLDASDETGRLAQLVFQRPKTRILLLSATPYKMYTMYQECGREDHYKDFFETVGFLTDSAPSLNRLKNDLQRYRELLVNGNLANDDAFHSLHQSIETSLRRIMVRTERLGATQDRSGMLENSPCDASVLKPVDLGAFRLLDRITKELNLGDAVEYWKSAPYLVNLMDQHGYKLKVAVDQCKRKPSSLAAVFRESPLGLLTWEAIRRFQRIPAQNARLRGLIQNKVAGGGWQLLWVPASMPYYRTSRGPYADKRLSGFTKSLVFSSWKIAPKAIAMLTSYEAERRMVTAKYPQADYEKERKRARLLQFNVSSGRRGGMNLFNLIYPCVTLATRIDPLVTSAPMSTNSGPPTLSKVAKAIQREVARLLDPITSPFKSQAGRPDERWYWVALAALDRQYAPEQVERWFENKSNGKAWTSLSKTTGSDSEGRFSMHVEEFQAAFRKLPEMGRVPKDLEEVVSKVAMASPAVAALRGLCRIPQGKGGASPELLQAAAVVGMGFRNLFNQPESMAMVRSLHRARESHYWKAALSYCLRGNLQSVIDEYLHMLVDSLGLTRKTDDEALAEIAEAIYSSASLRAVNLNFDEIVTQTDADIYDLVPRSMRCRFAMRFDDGRNEEHGSEVRKEHVRNAFNSPFRPFVLATTSIGQEGLDFHQYCHEIYHWNLPANPVDLEQREGRVHRYKGHVIRRNLAGAYPLKGLEGVLSPGQDPWRLIFEKARQARPDDANDLVPFWIFEGKGDYKIRRYVPLLPLSRENEQLGHLLASLAAYRLVLGQPRQEDLLNFIQRQIGQGIESERLRKFELDLAPH